MFQEKCTHPPPSKIQTFVKTATLTIRIQVYGVMVQVIRSELSANLLF